MCRPPCTGTVAKCFGAAMEEDILVWLAMCLITWLYLGTVYTFCIVCQQTTVVDALCTDHGRAPAKRAH